MMSGLLLCPQCMLPLEGGYAFQNTCTQSVVVAGQVVCRLAEEGTTLASNYGVVGGR